MDSFQSLMEKVIAKAEGWIQDLVLMAPNLGVALVVLLVAYVVSLALDFALRKLLGRLIRSASEARKEPKATGARSARLCRAGYRGSRQLTELFSTTLVIAVRLVALFIALGVLNLDKTVTSLLAGVGVIGLALGFAFRDIAANFMAGIMMALRRPFREGDYVDLAGQSGRVETIDLRSTRITTLDGLNVVIPNKDVFQNPITNYTLTPQRRMDLEVGVAYDADLEAVRAVVQDAVSHLQDRDPRRRTEVFFTGFGASSIDLVIRVWLTSSEPKTWLAARSNAIVAVKKAFDANDITIPFPIRTLDFGAQYVGGVELTQFPIVVSTRSA